MTVSHDYRRYVLERYQGEVYGEALFRSLARHSGDRRAKETWSVLERLERDTKSRLLPVVADLGMDTTEDVEGIRRGERHGARLAARPWRALMEAFRVELERFVSEFRAAETLAPLDRREILRHVTAHEVALLEFARRELAGRDDSLAPITAILESR